MSTQKRTRPEQSKINGARSNGPVTAAGKARSSLNHTQHGMYASRVVLENESQDIFNQLAALYYGLFDPRDPLEADLVENMIHARWKIRRLEAAQTAEFNLTIAEQRPHNTEKYGEIDFTMETALAYRASGRYLDVLEKHLDRQNRLFLRAFRALRACRGNTCLPSPDSLEKLEQSIPSNTTPPPEPETPAAGPENDRFEPETPGLLRKIAVIFVLLLTSIASLLAPPSAVPPERTPRQHANL